jgi:hypothetical protein
LVADPPVAVLDEFGQGSPLWRTVTRWQADARRDPRLRATLHSGLTGLQQRLDEYLHELLPEASRLQRQGRLEELSRLTSSFMQYCYERFEELAATLRISSADSVIHEELVEAW